MPPLTELDLVPRTVPQSRVLRFMEELGINLRDVAVGGVTINWESIKLTVFATDAAGKLFVDYSTEAPAVHNIVIPLEMDA